MSFLMAALGMFAGALFIGGALDTNPYFGGSLIGLLLGWLFGRDMKQRQEQRDLKAKVERLGTIAATVQAAASPSNAAPSRPRAATMASAPPPTQSAGGGAHASGAATAAPASSPVPSATPSLDLEPTTAPGTSAVPPPSEPPRRSAKPPPLPGASASAPVMPSPAVAPAPAAPTPPDFELPVVARFAPDVVRAPVPSAPTTPELELEPIALPEDAALSDTDIAGVVEAANALHGADAPAAAAPSRPAASPLPRPATAPPLRSGGQRIDYPAYTARQPEPDAIGNFFNAVKSWFTEGNVPVKIGMVVMIIGIGAFLKWAADQNLFSIPLEVKLAAVAVLGLAGLVFGWMQRIDKPAFGLSLQGGSIGILVLDVFASYRLYHVLDAGPTFALLILLVGAAGLLAVLQDSMALAMLGQIAGFLAPILVSTGSGNHVALFSYYSILNLAIFAIAWKKAWRPLNLTGFAFTFGIGTIWGVLQYKPEQFATTEPFLVLFFVLYTIIPILFALRAPLGRRGFVDGTLVFGTPLLAFMLQVGLLQPDRLPMAYSAFALAALYTALAYGCRAREELGNLRDSYIGLASVFATLAVPLAFSGRTTAMVWSIMGGALVWLGCRQQHRLMRWSGLGLQFLAVLAFLSHSQTQPEDGPILNTWFFSTFLMSFAAALSGYSYDRAGAGAGRAVTLLSFATFWWSVCFIHEIDRFGMEPHKLQIGMLWVATTGVIAVGLMRVLPWERLGGIGLATIAAAPLLAFFVPVELPAPFLDGGALSWLAYYAATFYVLYRLRDNGSGLLGAAHSLWLLTLVALLTWQANYSARVTLALDNGWVFAFTALPLALSTWLLRERPRIAGAPLGESFLGYHNAVSLPPLLAVIVMAVLACFEEGRAAPLPFVPIANPLELMQIALIVLMGVAARPIADDATRTMAHRALLALGFVALSAATLRAVHVFLGLDWTANLIDRRESQSALSVVWGLLATGVMIVGNRRHSRALWQGGFGLFLLILAKLALNDRRYLDTLYGWIAFMGVGGLLIAVGYFAPVPPKDSDTDEAEAAR